MRRQRPSKNERKNWFNFKFISNLMFSESGEAQTGMYGMYFACVLSHLSMMVDSVDLNGQKSIDQNGEQREKKSDYYFHISIECDMQN